jgi:hypothetical protein
LSNNKSRIKTSLRSSISAVKANIVPGMLLIAFALFIIFSYYYIKEAKFIFSFIAALKLEYGYIFSIFSTALFGGTIPFIFELFLKRDMGKSRLKFYLFLNIFWAVKGLEIDFFYRLQAGFFGNNSDFFTVFFKTLVDQLIYVPLWAAPTMIIAYHYRDRGFRISGIYSELKQDFLYKRMLPILFSGWMVWLPAVIIIYNLPLELQLPIQNIILCFWSLMMSFLSIHLQRN